MNARSCAPTARYAGDPPPLHGADIGPDLERQLRSAPDDTPVEAVLVLRRDGADAPSGTTPESLLQRVCSGDARTVVTSNYLPRLGTLIVRAYPRIIRRLIAQPEVVIACANRVEAGQPATAG